MPPESSNEIAASPEEEAIAYWSEFESVILEMAELQEKKKALEERAQSLIKNLWDRPCLGARIIIPEGTDSHLSRDNVPYQYNPEEFLAAYPDEITFGKLVMVDRHRNWLVINNPPPGIKVIPEVKP